ncbi:DNA ligase D [Devosia sp.]|uniref:DNA ligase D n=1 Tax=Devosia sp. TaxID=1871048 RepID=UPI002F1C5FC7
MAAAKLTAYRRKRDFSRTPEPAGAAHDPGGSRFVVHKHHATADHYDLRLELDGVLKSWAVPKGPSLDPAAKRYAVATEDHPLEYLDFEGVIPAGEYGGGPMIVWDRGDWAPMGDAHAALASGDFKFRLWGEKLKGGWMLVRLKPKPGDARADWLLFKEKDASAEPGTDILSARPESVQSGRTIEELAAAAADPAPAAPGRPVRLRPGALKGAVRAPMPARVKPQLATPSQAPPSGPGWVHEIKFDGYRTAAHFEHGAVSFITRAGLDWTRRYGELAAAFSGLPCKQAIIDGEVVVVDAHGVSHFADLQQALAEGASHRLTYYAFDLPYLDGWDLRQVPLLRRKQLLARLLAPVSGPRAALHYSDHVAGNGQALYDRASELGLEGIVSKRADAPYVEARTAAWVKTKALAAGDFPVVGYTLSAEGGGLAALGLGEWEGGELHWRGKVGTGFDAGELRSLPARLAPLRDGAPTLPRAPRDLHAVRPVLTARVHYANRTRDGSLRHAVFKGLREPEIRAAADAAPRRRWITDADLASIFVTNPGRRLFGSAGPTKLDVAVYYAQVGDFMLPHLIDRPVTLVRSPTGKAGDVFYQRHPFSGMPKAVDSFEDAAAGGERRRFIAIADAKGYLALAQFGVIEFHTWGCRRAALERPDRITFDLDPGEGVAFRATVAAALAVRQVLAGLGLTAFVKTSGGKGLHVVVPLEPRARWKSVHRTTGEIAGSIAAAHPDTFVTSMAKDKRRNRIFIDFHRNARSATAAAPYSLRARVNLPASAPVNWDDLASIDAPEDLNYSTLPEFVRSSGDPWADIDRHAAILPGATDETGV